jgi:hypothetical protein
MYIGGSINKVSVKFVLFFSNKSQIISNKTHLSKNYGSFGGSRGAGSSCSYSSSGIRVSIVIILEDN